MVNARQAILLIPLRSLQAKKIASLEYYETGIIKNSI